MRKSRFSDEQIVAVLQEWDAGAKMADLVRRHGVTEQTLYRWKKKYGGLQGTEAKRLKALEEENRQLKRLVADQALNLQVVKDLLGKSGDARATADGRHTRHGNRRVIRAASVPLHGLRALDASLPTAPTTARGAPSALTRARGPASALGLSSLVSPAAARRERGEQEARAAGVSRGGPRGPATQAEARGDPTHAAAPAHDRQSTVEHGLRQRRVE